MPVLAGAAEANVRAKIAAGDFPKGFRLAASLRGFDFGQGRKPIMPEQREKLEAAGLEIGRQLAAAGYPVERVDR